MLKTKSATEVIPWQWKLQTIVQNPCNSHNPLIKENKDPKINCIADIFMVTLHWIKNNSSGDLWVRLFDCSISIRFNLISHFCELSGLQYNIFLFILRRSEKNTVFDACFRIWNVVFFFFKNGILHSVGLRNFKVLKSGSNPAAEPAKARKQRLAVCEKPCETPIHYRKRPYSSSNLQYNMENQLNHRILNKNIEYLGKKFSN